MKRFTSILTLLFSMSAIGQNVTIDYQAWNPQNTTCSLFVNSTNVPASGTTSGTIEHKRKLGQTVYNNSDASIQMETIFQTTGSVLKGARYRIAYNFKANYSYIIYVTVAALENTVGSNTGPYIRLDVNNNGGGGSTECNGPETLTATSGGIPAAVQLSSNSFQEFQFVFPGLGVQPTLEVTAFPALNGGTKTVRVRKIRIVETPPVASFTLGLSPTTILCGIPVTFTVNGSNLPSGATLSYLWNLGANNGWLYNGVAAPASFSTTTNSITLTAATPNILTSNVTVTPVLNGVNQPILTSTLSFAPLPTYVVDGDNSVCTTSNPYTIPELPVGATVQWQAIPNNIVTINSPNAIQTTITKGYYSGIITLIATITNQCGQVAQAYKYNISVGSGVSSLTGRYYLNEPSQPHDLLTYYGGINYIPANTICNVFIDNPELESATWSLVSGNTNFWTQITEGANHILQMQLPYSNEDIVTFRLSNTNSCGTYNFDVLFVAQWQYGRYYIVSPNPTKDNLTISVDEAKLLANKVAKTSDQEIREIVILDKTGFVQAKQSFGKGTRQVNMNISNLKTGIYIVRLSNGKEWTAMKFIKE